MSLTNSVNIFFEYPFLKLKKCVSFKFVLELMAIYLLLSLTIFINNFYKEVKNVCRS